jgi:hypothetical protein
VHDAVLMAEFEGAEELKGVVLDILVGHPVVEHLPLCVRDVLHDQTVKPTGRWTVNVVSFHDREKKKGTHRLRPHQ